MHNAFTFAIQTKNMKTTETNYLETIYRAITQSTSAKNPSYGYFIEMLKNAVFSDKGKLSGNFGESFFVIEVSGMIIDSDEIYEWFSKK